MVSNTTHQISIELVKKGWANLKEFERLSNIINEQSNAGIISQQQFKKMNKVLKDEYGPNVVKTAKKHVEYTKRIKEERKEQDKITKSYEKASEAIGSFSVTLPLLFGFQSISQGMTSVIDPALQLVGATQLYNDFLAIKYLPTALNQLDTILETGDAWMEQSESQREAEGEMVLWVKQMSEAVSYTAQWAQIGAAIGESMPAFGRSIGAIAGSAFGAGTAIAVMSSETGKLNELMLGFEGAVGMGATDAVGGLMDKLGIFSDFTSVELSTDVKGLVDDFNNGSISVKEFAEELSKLPTDVQTKVLLELDRQKFREFKDSLENLDITIPVKVELQESTKEATKSKTGSTVKAVSLAAALTNPITSIPTIISLGKKLLGFADGGIVPGPIGTPVPAIVHGGERIIPNGNTSNNISPNITINANVSSSYDVRQLAEEIKRYLVNDFERATKGRSI